MSFRFEDGRKTAAASGSRDAWVAVLAALGLLAGGCGTQDPPHRAVSQLRLNDLQVIGSHNSYKARIDPRLFKRLLEERGESRMIGLDYGHRSLREQLDHGLRKLEIDVFHDPEGGLFAQPSGLEHVSYDAASYDPEGLMQEPGFKVLHVQDIDFESTCLTLQRCLGEIRAWSDAHPDHLPIAISFNAKDAAIPGLEEPLPFDSAALDALDRVLFAELGAEKLVLPDDIRGNRSTLREAVLLDGWPPLDECRGRFLLILDEGGEKRAAYVADHPSLRGRAMFTNSRPEEDEAAVLVLNDPLDEEAAIRDRVELGYLVRTRADADTREARTSDTRRRDAAFASGAHFVSTDYHVADERLKGEYVVEFPGGGVARCNPVRRSAGCTLDP